jgi:TPR repeat protein
MTGRCSQCGSERIHQSRIRPGERTASNLFLAPYRCRDCKARFWDRNNNAIIVAAIGTSSALLLGSLIWISFAPDEIGRVYVPNDLQTTLAGANQAQAASGKLSTNPILSAAIERDREIDIQTFKDEDQSLPDPNDNRFYTVSLFIEKAKSGSADAQYQLGLLYLAGRGTLQDFSEAAKWIILAAEQNHPLAQYELGLLYQAGQGVDLDNEKSYMWLNLAAAAGIEQAILSRDKTMRTLNSQQLMEAQKASREWLNSQKKQKKSK